MGDTVPPAVNLMLRSTTIAICFARFLVYFVVLMMPWPGLGDAYRAFFCFAGNCIFNSFGTHGSVNFKALHGDDDGRDVEVLLKNRLTLATARFEGRSRLTGYQPTAYVIALILAVPLPWSRRLRALVWGVLLVTMYVQLRLMVLLMVAFSGDTALALFAPGPILRALLGFADWVVVRSFAGSFVFPLCIWFAVTFRRQDWNLMRRPAESPRSMAPDKS